MGMYDLGHCTRVEATMLITRAKKRGSRSSRRQLRSAIKEGLWTQGVKGNLIIQVRNYTDAGVVK